MKFTADLMVRPLVVAVAAMVLAVPLLPSPAASAASPFPDGAYVISPGSVPYLALEAAGDASTPGTPVDVGYKSKISSRQWNLTDTGGGQYLIQPANAPTLALTVAGGLTADGSPLDLEHAKKDPTQLWSFTKVSDSIYLVSPQSANGSGLDDFGGGMSPGSKIDIWNDGDPTDPHLQWTINPTADVVINPSLPDGTYTVTPHDGPTLVMEAAAGALDPGTAVQGAAPTGAASQTWIFTGTGDGYMTVQPSHAKTMAMTVTAGPIANGTKLIIQPLKPGDGTQKWFMIEIPSGDNKGQFAFFPQSANGVAMDNPGGASTPGAQMQIWSVDLTNTHELWILKPVK